MLTHEGWTLHRKRVKRIRRRRRFNVPGREPRRGRHWLNEGSCIRLRPEHEVHLWAHDLVSGVADAPA